jgi:hypothetical protein
MNPSSIANSESMTMRMDINNTILTSTYYLKLNANMLSKLQQRNGVKAQKLGLLSGKSNQNGHEEKSESKIILGFPYLNFISI